MDALTVLFFVQKIGSYSGFFGLYIFATFSLNRSLKYESDWRVPLEIFAFYMTGARLAVMSGQVVVARISKDDRSLAVRTSTVH